MATVLTRPLPQRSHPPTGSAAARTLTTLSSLVDAYAAARQRAGIAYRTIEGETATLRSLVAFLAGHGIIRAGDLNRAVLEAWQDRQRPGPRRPRFGASSRARAAGAARSFLRWLATLDLIDHRLAGAVVAVRVPRLAPRPIPAADLERIVTLLKPRPGPYVSTSMLRDRALFFYMLSTAARISEALQVIRSDFDAPMVRQKGGGEKMLLSTPAARQAIQDYLARRRDGNPWLWVGDAEERPWKPLTPDGVRLVWIRLARFIGIRPWTSHQLRHTAATVLLNAGIPAVVIADHLGHRGLRTIHRYAAVGQRLRQEAVDAMNASM